MALLRGIKVANIYPRRQHSIMTSRDKITQFFTQYADEVSTTNDPCLLAAIALLKEQQRTPTTENHCPSSLSREIENVCRGIGHNFNGILANIRGTAEITQLKAPDLPEVAQQSLNTILALSDRGEYSTRMIRYYGRVFGDAGQALDLQATLPGLISDVRMNMNIRFPVELHYNVVATILCQREMLEGCVSILMRNALQAIQSGQPQTPRIELRLDHSKELKDAICLSIQDNGEGMTPDTRQQACKAFFTTRKAAEGVGLGLTIVRHFVTRQNGKMVIDSEPGQGTTVSLHLPQVS